MPKTPHNRSVSTTVVAPFADSESSLVDSEYGRFVPVAEWFTYDNFERAFKRLSETSKCDRLPSAWNDCEMSIARVLFREVYTRDRENLKHLLPFTAEFEDLVTEESGEILLLWPQRDIFVETALSIAERKDASVTVEIDTTLSHPTPEYFLSGATSSSGFRLLVKRLRAILVMGSIHLLLLVGSLFAPDRDVRDTHLLVADPTHREVTPKIKQSEAIAVSPLRPMLLDTVRAMKSGQLWEARDELLTAVRGETIYAEHLIEEQLLTLSPYSHLIDLIRTRDEFLDSIRDILFEMSIPEALLSQVAVGQERLLGDTTFLKYQLYSHLFNERLLPESFIMTAGGANQELLIELGRSCGTSVVDLHHSVQMYEPAEVHNRATTTIVKGFPDLTLLTAQDVERELVLTGRPYIDEILRLSANGVETKQLPEEMVNWETPVTVATEPIRHEHIRPVLQKTFESDGISGVCIKLHPANSREEYEQLLDDIETGETPYVIVKDGYDLFHLLVVSATIVTISSNVGLEALIAGVPALHADVPSNVALYYQTCEFFTDFVVPPEQLPAQIRRTTDEGLDEKTREIIRSLYLADGAASERFLSHFRESG